MHRWNLRLLAACAVLSAFPAAASAQAQEVPEPGSWSGNLNLFLGAKDLDDNWEPVDVQTQIGFEFDFRPANWPLNLAFDLLVSSTEEDVSDTVTATGVTLEFAPGVRKYWDPVDPISLFVGGGLTLGAGVRGTDTALGATSDSGWGTGIWADAGVVLKLADLINIGFELRYSFLPVTIFNEDLNAGGLQFGVVLGYHW